MSISFSADEIFAMAEQIELNGAKFYHAAARQVSDPQLAQLLQELAVMEIDHQKTFARMRSELSPSEAPPIFDPQDEVGMYLRALADQRVFDAKNDPIEKLTDVRTPDDILSIALGLEKDSIVFYLALEEYVPHSAGKSKVKAIIKQEMGHIALLRDKMSG